MPPPRDPEKLKLYHERQRASRLAKDRRNPGLNFRSNDPDVVAKMIRTKQENTRKRHEALEFQDLPWHVKRQRVIEEQGGKCLECGVSEWRGKPISLERHHLDGDSTNNARENNVALCPNCHSQTPTFKGRNKNKK